MEKEIRLDLTQMGQEEEEASPSAAFCLKDVETGGTNTEITMTKPPARQSTNSASDEYDDSTSSGAANKKQNVVQNRKRKGGSNKIQHAAAYFGGSKNGYYIDNEDERQQQHPERKSSSGGASVGTTRTSHFQKGARLTLWGTTALILIVGLGTSAAFLTVGLLSAYQDQDDQFANSATDLINKIRGSWEDYVYSAAVIHNRCRGRNFTRQEFRDLYEYLTADGPAKLEFQAAQFDPNITHAERADAEAEAEAYYAQYYPTVNYRGFVGFNTANATKLEPRWEAPFYFPIHYMEPVEGNEAAIDLDYYASGSRQQTVQYCMDEGQPALTDRLRLVQETEAVAYGVVLMHPGVNLTSQADVWPRDLASIVIRIPDLLRRSAENRGESSSVYIYDLSDSRGGPPLFLGAMEVEFVSGADAEEEEPLRLSPISEIALEDLLDQSVRYQEEDIPVANKLWAVVVVAVPGTFEADIVFVVLGGVIIFVASLCLALWVWTSTRRVARDNSEKSRSEAEKTALILDNARQAATAERELNDFLAHEVRNPVSAAMAACSFVKTAVYKEEPLRTEEAIQTTRDDVYTIENALKFVNDLLRNMLDMHRAMNKQLKVTRTPTDIRTDVLEPCCAMLTQRGGNLEVTYQCPPNLVVMSDRLRLKQVILNLGRNSAKFVESGFIRLSAAVVDGRVQMAVEDSGPGIPFEKRDKLFNKYQESLDLLSQGTGIGLFLCKNLVQVLGGDIQLDETFDSGIPGRPGCRFLIDLGEGPIDDNHEMFANRYRDDLTNERDVLNITDETKMVGSTPSIELPEKLSVLFVDDDPILRKLFARTIRTVAPNWEIREAANGETAVRLTTVEGVHFDLIFVDMYMASVEKQMLGTETVEVLRRKGIESRLCGLSANDKEKEFLEAGADCFTWKPFPCEPMALRIELARVLYEHNDGESNGQ